MAETNKTKWVDSFSKQIGATTTPGGTQQPTDKYDALEYTSYKDMLSSKIQASVAKDQAQKYIGASLNNAGFGGQGMAESTRLGIQGVYGKAISSADQTHQANLIDINRAKTEETTQAGEEKWQSAMTMLQQATSQTDLDYVKNNFYQDMTPDQQKMFDYYYASYGNSFNGGSYTSLDSLNNATYQNEKGNVETLGENFAEEAKVLWHNGSVGNYQNGDVVKVTNGQGETVYMKWAGNGFATTTQTEYDNAKTNNVNSFELTRGKDKNNNYSQTNKKN